MLFFTKSLPPGAQQCCLVLIRCQAHLRRSHQSGAQLRQTPNSWHESQSMTPTPPQWSSDQHSAVSQQSTNAQLVTKQARTTRFTCGARCDDESPPSVETRGAQGLVAGKSAAGCNFPQEEVDQDGRLSVSASVSASGSWDTNASSCSNRGSRVKEFEQSVCRIRALYRNRGGDMRSAQVREYIQYIYIHLHASRVLWFG